MPTYRLAPDLGKPPPRHLIAAQEARAALPAEPPPPTPVPDLVTQHLPPWRTESGMLLKGSPRSFYDAALAAGCAVMVLVAGGAVEVRVDGGRIRAWWVDGRTTGAVVREDGITRAVGSVIATHVLNITMTLADAERVIADARAAAAAKRAAKKAAS